MAILAAFRTMSVAFALSIWIICAFCPVKVSGRYRRSNGAPCARDEALTSAEALEKEEERANMVFTGTVERLYKPAPFYHRFLKNDVISRGARSDYAAEKIYRGVVRVKRVLKGDRNLAENTVIVEGFGDPSLCVSDVREKDTRIFMVKQGGNGRLRLSSSLLRLNLNTLDRTIAAVKDLPYKKRPAIEEKPCEKMYCAFGAYCLVDEKSRQAICQCQETCAEDLFAPVCGSDGVTYSSECQLRVASCTRQKRIFVRHQGSCDLKNPCQDKACNFGAECRPSLDGRSSECVCPERCATYGDSRGSRPVCGSDGQDYPNICELRRSACKDMKDLYVKYQGRCDPCEGVECPASQVCQLDDSRNPICRCNAVCSEDLRPVCGSDGKTYSNECALRVEACKSRRSLRVVYSGECSTGANPCESLKCGPGQECDIDKYGIATCQCPATCEPIMRPVCGSDGTTYDSDCELRRQGCTFKKPVMLNHPGVCGEQGPCHGHNCQFGAICILRQGKPICECPTCSEEFQPVCGSDGISYTNDCKMRKEACEQKVEIKVDFPGLCNGCENKKCEFYSICERNSAGEVKCACPKSCVKLDQPVCGSDSDTYPSECHLRVASCEKKIAILVASRGPCDVCEKVHCKYGARCEDGQCVCPSDCPDTFEPVCANDGSTYSNECEMRKSSCQQSQELNALFYGECEDAGASGNGLGSGAGTERCDEKSCLFGGVCDYDTEGLTTCVCHSQCPTIKEPVCGSDGKLYDNECRLREEACKQQKQIKTWPLNKCKVALIKSCVDTVHGCCPDGKTAAQGAKHAGCPSVCQCNRLGSYGQTCDPVSLQCPCKPGVGGLRCDRCEAGFWGLHKISEGNIGCIPCTCNEHGSVRDDCEQMTGRCVCRHGIQGMKCDICPQGMELIAGGCTDESIARTVPGTCAHLTCRYGATCREKDERAQCVCDIQCPTNGDGLNQQTVCGSDGTTYGSECQLQLFSCRYQKTITVWAQGACQKGFNVAAPPTVGPVRRSTVQKTSTGALLPVAEVGKSTRELPDDSENKLPENLFLSTVPTVVTPIEKRGPVMEESPVETPAFSGRSFLEMAKLNANSRLSIELEFRTFAAQGILLYNGQTPAGKGDFVSLAINDGYVEFRYNLGSGAVTLRSPQKLQVGRYHRLVAKRYLRDGLLSLDDKEDVSGRSQGMLKSLNLEENLYLGAVPTKSKGVFDNIGVTSGFVGCIRRLRIGHKEIDLRYPKSKDIIKGNQIAECTQNPCSSLPCLNGATCLPTTKQSFTCKCREGFSGDSCQLEEDKSPCDKSSSRKGGKPCSEQSKRGVKAAPLEDELYVPAFDGNSSYLKLAGLSRVGQALSLELWFLARSPDGVLLYNGQLKPKAHSTAIRTRSSSAAGDFVSLNLADGFVQFRYDLGSGFANLSSREPVEMHKWHKVKASRSKRHGTLIVDDQDTVLGESKAPMNELNLGLPLYLGGVPDWASIKKDSGVAKNFDGAIQRLVINGEVTDNLLKSATSSRNVRRYEGDHPCRINPCLNGGTCVPQLGTHICKCQTHFMGPYCEIGMGEMIGDRPVKFDGKTFFRIPNKITRKMGTSANVNLAKENWVEGQRENRISVRFRTSHAQGLLLWINKGATIRGDYMALTINEGYVELSYNLGRQKEITKVRGTRKVNDGKWHTALVHRNKRLGILTVDDTSSVSMTSEQGATELNTDGVFWIGGASVLPSGLPIAYYQGFAGCMDRLYLDGDPVNLLLAANGHRHKVRFCGDS